VETDQQNNDVIMNTLKGLLWLNKTAEAIKVAKALKLENIDLDFICKRVYAKE
jgi:hypothetical protein